MLITALKPASPAFALHASKLLPSPEVSAKLAGTNEDAAIALSTGAGCGATGKGSLCWQLRQNNNNSNKKITSMIHGNNFLKSLVVPSTGIFLVSLCGKGAAAAAFALGVNSAANPKVLNAATAHAGMALTIIGR